MTLGEAPNATPDPVEAAKAEAMREANSAIAKAKLEAEAARKGVDVSGMTDYVNTAAFLAEDGSVNADAIAGFVSSLTPKQPAFDPDIFKNAGNRNSEQHATPYSPESFKGMSRAEIAALVNSGRLDKLIK
jgi:hypothetical protein